MDLHIKYKIGRLLRENGKKDFNDDELELYSNVINGYLKDIKLSELMRHLNNREVSFLVEVITNINTELAYRYSFVNNVLLKANNELVQAISVLGMRNTKSNLKFAIDLLSKHTANYTTLELFVDKLKKKLDSKDK